jgi:hypothetical protein
MEKIVKCATTTSAYELRNFSDTTVAQSGMGAIALRAIDFLTLLLITVMYL